MKLEKKNGEEDYFYQCIANFDDECPDGYYLDRYFY